MGTQEVKILTAKAVCELLGISRATLRRRRQADDFPDPIRLGAANTRRIGWRVSDLEAWVASHQTQGFGPARFGPLRR